MRLDKWLWAARFFKTRTQAASACELGRIECNGQRAKPAREVHIGDRLQVRNGSGDFQLQVALLSQMRGPAAIAQTLYVETEESKQARLQFAEERRTRLAVDAFHKGKLSKRERRKFDQLRGRP